MKRWILTIEGCNIKPKIYANTSEEAKNHFKFENVIDVLPDDDFSYLDDIHFLINHSKHFASENNNDGFARLWYETNLPDGRLRFILSIDLSNDLFLDYASYQFLSNDAIVYPFSFNLSSPKEIREKFFCKP